MRRWWAGVVYALTPLVCLFRGHRWPEHAPDTFVFCERCGDYNGDDFGF